MPLPTEQNVLLQIASALDDRDYAFLCPTPESHERLFRRASDNVGSSMEDLFGWSLRLPASKVGELLGDELVRESLLVGILREKGGMIYSTVRLSNLVMSSFVDRSPGNLYVHSAYPTTASNSVFFGPDTYLFLDFINEAYRRSNLRPRCVVDVACGAGAGAIALQRLTQLPGDQIFGLDLNPESLKFATVNAQIAQVEATFLDSDLFTAVRHRKDIDLIISNPPYIASSEDTPMYSAGGELDGLSLPIRIAEEAIETLAPGGTLMLYTGVPISFDRPGHDPLLHRLREMEGTRIASYHVILPDIFGEELSHPAYVNVGRIQAVGAVVIKT